MTPDVIYSTICEKWARTVLLLADEPGMLTFQLMWIKMHLKLKVHNGTIIIIM